MLETELDPQRFARAAVPIRRFLGSLAVAMLALGCTSSPSSPTPDRAPTPALISSPAQTEATSQAPPLRLVAIGDSIAAAQLCECARYPDVYGRLAGEALGRPVLVRNLAVVRTTSGDLLRALESSRDVQSAIQDADIITISIGINDIGPCDGDRRCYGRVIPVLETNLEALHGQIDTLQGDHPHILRQTAYYNFSIGAPGEDQTDRAFYADQLAALNATICAAVAAHDGLCVDLLRSFNGPGGDQDAGPLLVFDHVHPSRAGMNAIAEAIAAAGYAPLGR